MKREDLKNLGLTDEQIEKVMAEYGKDITSLQKKVNGLTNERDGLKSQLDYTVKFSTVLSGVMPIIKGIGAAAVDGAQKASDLQNAYVKTFNLLTTGGEKAAEATKNVAKMQAEGKEMSVQYGVSQQKIADGGYSSSQTLGSMKTMLQPV